jgi:purine-binding chemotaxis protein CheW
VTDHPASRDADALRAEFDTAFARASAPAASGVSLLAIRIGGSPYAIRVLDARGLVPVSAVVPVPSGRPEVLGIVGLRGEILPVYGLARMVLGAEDDPPRWLILAGATDRVGLGFTGFEGHLVAAQSELMPASGHAGTRHVRELYTGTPPRPVLDLASLVSAATARTDRESP